MPEPFEKDSSGVDVWEAAAMEMHQIRYFLAVSRTLNFTRAAEECNVSQPALTRAIHLLETELGGELLRRERTHSHLSPLGQRMLPYLQQCYHSAVSAKSLAQEIRRGETTSLAIAVARTINAALLQRIVGELSGKCASAQLHLYRGTRAEVVELLKKGDAEFAVAGPLGESWDRLDSWRLFSEPFELIVGRDHRLAGRNAIDVPQLAGEQFILQDDLEVGDELVRRLRECGVAVDGAHRLSTDEDLIALVEGNLGVAIVPSSSARSDRLRRISLHGLDLTRTVAVYGVAGRRRSPVATTLLNLVRAADWSRYAD